MLICERYIQYALGFIQPLIHTTPQSCFKLTVGQPYTLIFTNRPAPETSLIMINSLLTCDRAMIFSTSRAQLAKRCVIEQDISTFKPQHHESGRLHEDVYSFGHLLPLYISRRTWIWLELAVRGNERMAVHVKHIHPHSVRDKSIRDLLLIPIM